MPQRTQSGGAPKQPETAAPTAASTNDPWQQLDNAVSTSGFKNQDEGGFDRMNTKFYLKDGEEAAIAFLSEVPVLFNGHNLQSYSRKGTSYYHTVPCQKKTQGHCLYCQAGHAARQQVAFVILDGRGQYDGTAKAHDPTKPAAMIFLTSLPLAKVISKARQDIGGTFGTTVFTLNKAAKAYSIAPKMAAKGGGNFELVQLKAAYEGDIPQVEVIYAPDDDATAEATLLNAAAPQGYQQRGVVAPGGTPPAADTASYKAGGGLFGS